MRVFKDFEDVSQIKKPFVTIGSFDGVHRGHRDILTHLCQMARDSDAQSTVITFSAHPRNVLNNDDSQKVKLINSLEEKLELLEQIGINNVIVTSFTKDFSQVPYSDFVSLFLVDKLHMNTLMVGYNHHFGYKKGGDSKSLASMSDKLGFNICEMAPKQVEGDKVSSTIIREKIACGDIRNAARLLGYNYFITARIDAFGSVTLCEPMKILPPQGEYIVRTCEIKKEGFSELSQSGTCVLTVGTNNNLKLFGSDVLNVKNRSIVRIFFAE